MTNLGKSKINAYSEMWCAYCTNNTNNYGSDYLLNLLYFIFRQRAVFFMKSGKISSLRSRQLYWIMYQYTLAISELGILLSWFNDDDGNGGLLWIILMM